MWTAVVHARGEVLEAVGVPMAASIIKGLTLHGGHIEEEAGQEGTAGTLLFRKPADLGNLWDSETRLLALLIALEVIGIPLAASIVENLALLGDGVVVKALDVSPAWSLVHLEETHGFG